MNASLIQSASLLQSYDNSHFQLTKNHPLADSLPWTKQYRPCGQGGDSVVVPLSFLSNDDESSGGFTESIRGQLLLHEWTKFRYGAFDEIGYSGDVEDSERKSEVFTGCYTNMKQAYLTTCTSARLPAISLNKSACSLAMIENQRDFLLDRIEQSSFSIMALPTVETDLVQYCNDSGHNIRPMTKQNVYCRKSVMDVVTSHPDFAGTSPPQTTSTSTSAPSAIQVKQGSLPAPEIRILKHPRQNHRYTPAYCFIIDESKLMRDDYKLLHVKQAVAQFIQMLELGTETHLTIFSGDAYSYSENHVLEDDDVKALLLGEIMRSNRKQNVKPVAVQGLSSILDNVIRALDSSSESFSWNVFLFADSIKDNTDDISDALKVFEATTYPISIFTFEAATATSAISDEWLKWYRIPHTRNLLILPHCKSSQGPCSLQTSSFILDYLTSSLNDQQVNPRFIQKVAQAVIPNGGGQSVTFSLESIEQSSIKGIYFFMSLPGSIQNAQSIKLIPPSGGTTCNGATFLGYNQVVNFIESETQNCTYHNGQWTLRLDSQVSPRVSHLLLNAYVELDSDEERLIITPTLGHADLTRPVPPNASPNLTPLFVSVQTPEGNPILDADVSVKMYYPNLLSSGTGFNFSKDMRLLDDGDFSSGADQTGNDGIYSAYLTGFSKTSASHIMTVQVTGKQSQTKILEAIYSPGAIFLDERMTEKCCGKAISPRDTRSLNFPVKFQSLHFGFKTLEGWTKVSQAPGTIGSITVTNETNASITVEFDSVAGDVLDPSVTIDSILPCCVPGNDTSESPTEYDCKATTPLTCGEFKRPPAQQNCTIDKKTLINSFVSTEEMSRVQGLFCRLRVANSQELSQVSNDIFEVNVASTISTMQQKEDDECESVSDGCLPIWVFWTLIGIVGGLVLVIILILMIWFACSRRQKKDKYKENERVPPTPTPRTKTSVKKDVSFSPENSRHRMDDSFSFNPKTHNNDKVERPNNVFHSPDRDEPKVVRELFINHAYIQDADGEVKIITDNGQILTKPKGPQEQNSMNNDMTTPTTTSFRRIGDPTIRTFQTSSPPPPRSPTVVAADNMQVFKPTPFPKADESKPQQPKQRLRNRQLQKQPHAQPRLQIVHANPMLRSDSEPQMSELRRSPSPQPLHSHSRQGSEDPAIVYATVSRARRIAPPSGNSQPYGTVRNPSTQPVAPAPLQVSSSPHYMTPQDSRHHLKSRNRGGIPNFSERVPSPPPPQVRPYPSDSESSIDHRVIMRPPKFMKPPPYPVGSQLVSSSSTNSNIGLQPFPIQQKSATPQPRSQPTGQRSPTSLAPPSQMQQQRQHQPITSPGVPPPVPPPRYTNAGQLPPLPLNRRSAVAMSSSDEDSDNWDDGEYNYEFDNTTGVSYA